MQCWCFFLIWSWKSWYRNVHSLFRWWLCPYENNMVLSIMFSWFRWSNESFSMSYPIFRPKMTLTRVRWSPFCWTIFYFHFLFFLNHLILILTLFYFNCLFWFSHYPFCFIYLVTLFCFKCQVNPNSFN